MTLGGRRPRGGLHAGETRPLWIPPPPLARAPRAPAVWQARAAPLVVHRSEAVHECRFVGRKRFGR